MKKSEKNTSIIKPREASPEDAILLDKKDRKLLLALFADGRAPTTRLAKTVGISQEVVVYRLARLKRQGILKRVIAVVDEQLLGNELYQLKLKFKATTNEAKQAFFAAAKAQPCIRRVIKLAGDWDASLSFCVANAAELNTVHDALLRQRGSIVSKKELHLVAKNTYAAPTLLLPGTRKTIVVGERGDQRPDQLSAGILAILREDGRATLVEIAQRLDTSVATAHHRLAALEQQGIIKGYRPVVDFTTLGFDRFRVGIELENPADEQKLGELLVASHNVRIVRDLTGREDLEFECDFLTAAELFLFMDELKRNIAIRETSIMFRNEEI